jgi:hypothetical protein
MWLHSKPTMLLNPTPQSQLCGGPAVPYWYQVRHGGFHVPAVCEAYPQRPSTYITVPLADLRPGGTDRGERLGALGARAPGVDEHRDQGLRLRIREVEAALGGEQVTGLLIRQHAVDHRVLETRTLETDEHPVGGHPERAHVSHESSLVELR